MFKRVFPALVLAAVSCCRASAADDLAAGFVNPPASAKSHTWWHWMNGNITKEGITADLEALARVGVGGVQIFNAGENIPHGAVDFNSPQWRALVKHAAAEAQRLGLEVCIHNCAGWSSSGGPWNTPEHGMQIVVTSETKVTGPKPFQVQLGKPATRFPEAYRDIAVLAFPTPAAEAVRMTDAKPVATCSDAEGKPALAFDGKRNTALVLPNPTPAARQWLQYEFAQPYEARQLTIVVGAGMESGNGQLQVSDDGVKFKSLRGLVLGRGGQAHTFGFEAAKAKFWRVSFTSIGGRSKRLALAEVTLESRLGIENFEGKALYDRVDRPTSNNAPTTVPADLVVPRGQLLDLTAKLGADGKVAWDVPAGSWTVLRVGYAPNGRNNHPAPKEGTGLEVDKFSREALDAHWAGHMGKLTEELGPLTGASFNNVLIDSYEVGTQNWTPKFREEFTRRRGYDPLPYLPIFTGRVVDSPAVTERFLWDLRRTGCDLMAENYFGHMAQLAHQHGMLFSVEPYGNGAFEEFAAGKDGDVPMGEFWGQAGGNGSTKLAGSLAHVYGRKFVGAESFTCAPEQGRWTNDPFKFKLSGDSAWASGINRFIFHRYAHQPWLNRFPGMTMGQWGFHFDRTNTWFEQSTGWLKYHQRGQYLLQSGTFVADVLNFCGEDTPNSQRGGAPQGYDWDGCGRDAVMDLLAVRDGRLVTPSGMSYAVLTVPDDTATPAFLRKLRQLVSDGATVVGPKPTRSPSLQDYPDCDQAVKDLAGELWGDCDGKTITSHKLGRGRVVWGQPLETVLRDGGVQPDFAWTGGRGTKVAWLHRHTADTEFYFVANQVNAPVDLNLSFRQTGRTPELWYADSGLQEVAPVWTEADGRINVPLHFAPAESVFVVFRAKAVGDHLVGLKAAVAEAPTVAVNLPPLVITKAVYEAVDGEGAKDVTALLNAAVKGGRLSVQASNEALGGDPTPLHVKHLRLEYTLAGKPGKLTVPENQQVELPDSGPVVGGAPAGELHLAGGAASLLAWQPGSFELTSATGRVTRVDVPAVPAPVEVTGAWDVRFPPNWGAPTQVTFDKLTNWAESADAGLKYFSGTATYTKRFDLPDRLLAPGVVLYLDLGTVKNLAQVKLNGRDLGVLWKPPFRVALAGVAQAGSNDLEVKVTNLWPNRLIGDEQLPDDRKWNGKSLVEWPQWVLDGQPSPTGRYTFTTWHHWTKDDALLDSGLLGPVKVVAAVRKPVQ